jgi:hypothetical protein
MTVNEVPSEDGNTCERIGSHAYSRSRVRDTDGGISGNPARKVRKDDSRLIDDLRTSRRAKFQPVGGNLYEIYVPETVETAARAKGRMERMRTIVRERVVSKREWRTRDRTRQENGKGDRRGGEEEEGETEEIIYTKPDAFRSFFLKRLRVQCEEGMRVTIIMIV